MTIRDTLKFQRKNLSQEQQNTFSKTITKRLVQSVEFQQATNIACYLAMPGEVQTQDIIEAIWHAKKQCYVPIIAEQTLQFVLFTPNSQTIKSHLGFQQPAVIIETIAVDKLDVVITPLIGFDAQCNRLGMGAGYYDRTFAFLNTPTRPSKPQLLGIAYALQQVDKIEKQIWDVSLNKIITETTIFPCFTPQID